ncbi:MAG: glycogen debranching N-terminal domain-containing protein [Knoellia sp.]
MTRYHQPWLHDLEIAVLGNVTALSNRLGDMGVPGAGLYVDDRRVLSVCNLTVDGEPPTWVASASGGSVTQIATLLRSHGDDGPDPTVELHRVRELVDQGMRERVIVTSHASDTVRARLTLQLASDGVDIAVVKGGGEGQPVPVALVDGALRWQEERHDIEVRGGSGSGAAQGDSASWTWDVVVAQGEAIALELNVAVSRRAEIPFAANAGYDLIDWSEVSVDCDDARVRPLVDRSLLDLRGLLMTDPQAPQDVFPAAGTPWYLTLFGRDSLWAARFMLPFGTDLAGGTLRALARRQGTQSNPLTAEDPGKILHEVRRAAYVDPVSHLSLPPVYFGSVDATPLWIQLLHDAWRWGLDESTVRDLRLNLLAALGWMRAQADRGDGLLSYLDESGGGLDNQGWKDSGDSMRRSDGSIAPAPIALVETQAYAVSAARAAAHLLEGVWGEDGDSWRQWADDLSDRIRERFWVSDADVRYLAMAIDGEGRRVDGVGSNMGHVLGAGVLNEAEARRTTHVLTRPDMLGSGGICTLSRDNPAYNPVGYHTGSVWTHDNAIAALGLGRDGFAAEAAQVLKALVGIGSSVDNRWPELYGGELLMGRPVPYPASCRPQAWAAASAGALVEVALGLAAEAPNHTLHLSPIAPAPFGAMRVTGLRVGQIPVRVEVNAEGEVVDVDAPGLDVIVR